VRGQHPNDPRNFTPGKVQGDDVWEEAAKLAADKDGKPDVETVKKSYALIRRAGGAQTTLPSYKLAVVKRDRRRKKVRVGSYPSSLPRTHSKKSLNSVKTHRSFHDGPESAT